MKVISDEDDGGLDIRPHHGRGGGGPGVGDDRDASQAVDVAEGRVVVVVPKKWRLLIVGGSVVVVVISVIGGGGGGVDGRNRKRQGGEK